jgi:hypothetical protein
VRTISLWTLLAFGLASRCARFKSTVTERTAPGGTIERVTVVKVGTLYDSKSELAKLSSGQTDKCQKVRIGSFSYPSTWPNEVRNSTSRRIRA